MNCYKIVIRVTSPVSNFFDHYYHAHILLSNDGNEPSKQKVTTFRLRRVENANKVLCYQLIFYSFVNLDDESIKFNCLIN